jgi:FHA domain
VFEKFKKIVSGGGKPPVVASGRARPAAPLDAKPQATPREIPCPNCGEPMLSGWGTTCGTCRPGLVAPKTLFLSRDSLAASGGMEAMTLGWLVVVSTLEQRQRGALLQLDQDRSVLSRGEGGPNAQPGLFEFSDIFMSSGHAIVTRPRTGDRRGAFSIREREGAPTANGTFVNSRRIPRGESVDLADGDEIKVGATQMVFRSLWLAGSDARTS